MTARRAPRARRSDTAPRGERLLGRVEWVRGRLVFAPARSFRHHRRPLTAPRGLTPEPGDLVVAEVFEDRDDAVLVEVFGAEDDPRYDDLAVASRHRLARSFSRTALAEADACVPPTGPLEPGRVDLSDRAAFTMDPVDAQDFDDALSWRPLDGGGCEVGIHIADVAHYVRPGTALDDEATERATSVYLSSGAVPMLPHRLSSDLCSLRPNEPRLTMSVLAEFDARGGLAKYRLVSGRIQSRARLTYESGQAILDQDAAARAAVPAEVVRSLVELSLIAARMRERRMRRGALDLDVGETKAKVDEEGRPYAIERRAHLATMSVVEEFMLLANLLVGEEAERRDGPFLYRVHAPPALGKLAQLDAMLASLQLPRLSGGSGAAEALGRLLATSLVPEKRRLVHQLVLRTLARAVYAADDIGHFGLAVRGYSHFTSPIRRYPDLFNHRQVKRWLEAHDKDDERELDAAEVETLALHTSAREQGAAEAERESVRVKSLRFVEDRIGDVMAGTITGVVPVGVFVELDEVPVDGFVRVAGDRREIFRMDDAGVRLTSTTSRRRYSLGDRVTVRLVRMDVAARELELVFEGAPAGHTPGKSGRPHSAAPRERGARRRKAKKKKHAGRSRGRRR